MLIAIDAEPANREKRTGVENVVFNLICRFVDIDGGRADRQYVLFTRHELGPHWPQLPANFKHVKLGWPSRYFWAHLRLGLALRRLKPDVTFIPGNIISPLAPRPIVTVIHDIVFVEHPELHTGRTLASHVFALKQALKRAEVIVTPTAATKQSLLDNFPSMKTPIEVVPWAVDREIFRNESDPNDQDILRKFNLLGKRYFLYVGRMEAKKNTDGLIKAFEKLKLKHADLELVTVGPGGSFGYQPSDVTAVLYRHALAFVFPSFYEGFGMPLLEAMSCGCAVACSSIPVLREVGGQAAVYFDPHNIDNMVEVMESMLEENLRAKLKVAGIEKAAEYSWQGSARQVIGILEKSAE